MKLKAYYLALTNFNVFFIIILSHFCYVTYVLACLFIYVFNLSFE